MAAHPADKTVSAVRIGTRGSPLALAQAHEVRDRLVAAHGSGLAVSIESISTKGDRIIDRSLSQIGGKGLFTKEIEERLKDGRIDIAVHSSKDMPTKLPQGVSLSCFLTRETPNDAFISRKASNLRELPEGAVLGTSSLRRRAMLLRLRPDLEIVEFRGNVQTRLKKLEDGVADATLLAMAGLKRLGTDNIATCVFDLDEFPPAPGQGAICIESRIGDTRMDALLAPLNDSTTATALTCERAFLETLDGSCRTPIAGYAAVDGGKVNLHGMILSPDGQQCHECRDTAALDDAAALGRNCGKRLRAEAGETFFKDWPGTN